MGFIQLRFRLKDFQQSAEILTALLAEQGFEGFHELEPQVFAFIAREKYEKGRLEEITALPFFKARILELQETPLKDQNWNAVWESGFKPVIIEDICTIVAPFHDPPANILSIHIEPKMSFGTGHHETTRLMIKAMSLLDLSGLEVLDMGAGTGVLGIYALKRKAGRVCSVDVDDWAIENCQENFIRNACPASSWITVQAGSPEQLDSFSPDIILANINRNILIEHLPGYARLLPENGILLLSGIYDSDREVVIREAGHNGLKFESVLKENAWICLKFRKLGD